MQEKFEDDELNQAYVEYAELPADIIGLPTDDFKQVGNHTITRKEGILRFNRDDMFQNDAFKRAVTADDAYSALWAIEQVFQYEYKHHNFRNKSESETFSKIKDRILGIIQSKVDMNLYN